MKYLYQHVARYAVVFVLFVLGLAPVEGRGDGYSGPLLREAKLTTETAVPHEQPMVLDHLNPGIQKVMALQERHTPQLLAIPEVVGTAVGVTAAGIPAVLVFTREAGARGVIPENLEGTPVVVIVTGEISAMAGTSTTSWFDSPVPIGISTGNIGECSAGTIGARVNKTDGTVYALSNNHVYALENTAPLNSSILQPGLYDSNCSNDNANQIGKLSAFVPIKFKRGTNTVDAAIAQVNYDPSMRTLGNATPSDGYGTPGSTTVSASIGQSVQKYGRTTAMTMGAVNGINATIKVGYGRPFGFATFVKQITVGSATAFILPGDSGSLLVTNDISMGNNPVGLLFAGNSSGTFAVANPIALVLTGFGITIDGK